PGERIPATLSNTMVLRGGVPESTAGAPATPRARERRTYGSVAIGVGRGDATTTMTDDTRFPGDSLHR
ncbi:MAG: hypothetical protein ABUL77_01810, partial [Bacteroidota bacterium]